MCEVVYGMQAETRAGRALASARLGVTVVHMNDEWRPPTGLDPESFERLPESAKEEIRRQKVKKEALLAAYQLRLRARARSGVLLGALGSGLVAAFVPGTWLYPLLMALSGGALGYVVVVRKLGHINGICLFGFSAVLLALVCIPMNGEAGSWAAGGAGAALMGSWLFQIAIGYMVSKVAEEDRTREDTF